MDAHITDFPKEAQDWLRTNAGRTTPAPVEDILPGDSWESVRTQLMSKGVASYRTTDGDERVMAADVRDGKVFSMAAAIPRGTGKATDFLNTVSDFQDLLTATTDNRKEAIALFHKIARADGISNNAINKMAALVAPEGKFKVRSVNGETADAGNAEVAKLETLLNWWKDNVNARSLEAVITGDRGITSFISQGTRLQLIEGDHIARHVWSKITVPPLGEAYSLPMNLQTFSAGHIEIPAGLEGTNHELLYWVPPKAFIKLLEQPEDKNLKKALEKVLTRKVITELVKTGRYFLDPALLIHIKHRATQIDTFGQSLLEPTLNDIRYKRALDALELTVIMNLMARMVIIKLGSDDKDSIYHAQEVTNRRLGLLQRIMSQVGPSATILWPGPDIQVIEVSAHDSLPELESRYRLAERRQLMSLGLPAVLMIGEGTDGKATAFATALTVAAQLSETQYQYEQTQRSIGERIAMDNGFEGMEVTWEWIENKLADKREAAELIVKLFSMGLLSTETSLDELGYDYQAEELRQKEDVSKGYKSAPFEAPPSARNNPAAANPTGDGGDDGGRPTQKEDPKQDPRTNRETKSPVENK